jgi:hypothetical protein
VELQQVQSTSLDESKQHTSNRELSDPSTTSASNHHTDPISDTYDVEDYAGGYAYDITPMPSSEGPELWNGLLPRDIDADEYDHLPPGHGDASIDINATAGNSPSETDITPAQEYIHVMGKKVPVKRQRVRLSDHQMNETNDMIF